MCTLLLAAIIAYTFPICLEAFAPSAHSTFTTFRSRAPVSIPKTTDLQSTKGFELSDLFYDDTSTAFDAWEWTSNLGAPAALVAGAVLVTLGETRNRLIPKKSDMQWVRVTKQLTRFLLLTSFAFEVVSIFVSTVTGKSERCGQRHEMFRFACFRLSYLMIRNRNGFAEPWQVPIFNSRVWMPPWLATSSS